MWLTLVVGVEVTVGYPHFPPHQGLFPFFQLGQIRPPRKTWQQQPVQLAEDLKKYTLHDLRSGFAPKLSRSLFLFADEPIFLVAEEHVEGGQGAVNLCDVLL